MLTMPEADERIRQQMHEVAEFKKDVDWIHRDLIVNHYPIAEGRENYGFAHTCHAYVMLTFSWIDALSAFWAGGRNANDAAHTKATVWSHQTDRMVAFLNEYHSRQNTMHHLAVELWRHTLMHESRPRELIGVMGEHYRWLLVWEMDLLHHYTLETRPPVVGGDPYTVYVFLLGVLPLVENLAGMVTAYCRDLAAPEQEGLRQNYAAREAEIQRQRFKL
jgi:hypothetical protein